jgi:major membrane immunogen (membrane-anchored lipoprotein)
MTGLQKILKAYGDVKVTSGGKTVVWTWDYAKDEPRIKSEMSKEEIMASEKAKFKPVR